MLLKLVASFLLLKLGKGELTEVLPSGDMQADPENYPYALRIVAYNTSELTLYPYLGNRLGYRVGVINTKAYRCQ